MISYRQMLLLLCRKQLKLIENRVLGMEDSPERDRVWAAYWKLCSLIEWLKDDIRNDPYGRG